MRFYSPFSLFRKPPAMPVEASRKKSFSFKHRAKRVENNNPKNSYALDKNA